MKISAAILVAFMLLMLPAAASGLVEGGENISYDEGAGNDALVLSAEGEATPSAEVTVAPTDVSITANRENLVRNNDFCVTIRGESKKQYSLFVEDASISDAGYPLIKEGQSSVEIIGDAPFPDAPAAAIANEKRAGDGVHFPDQTAALVQTDVSGARTVGLTTSSFTAPRSFSITVIDPEDETRVDTVTVTVEEGEVTITAEGAGTYYLGEEIALSGTNTAGDTTYLFLTGPDLGCGVPLDDPALNASDGIYVVCEVAADDTWEYRWDTSPLGRDLGTSDYTIYAVTADHDLSGNFVDLDHLDGVKCTVAVVGLQRPYPTATLNTSVLQPGDSLLISGTTTGSSETLSLWIFSQKHLVPGVSVPVGADGTFEYVLEPDETRDLSGQSFTVIQHPGANGLFDVKHDPVEGKPYQIRDASGNAIDLGSLSGSEACSVFIEALNSPDSDDTHSKIPFFVEGEEWIRIDPIEEAYRNDIVTITGTADPVTAADLCVKVSPHVITLPGEPGISPGKAWGEVIVQGGPQKSTWSFSFDTSGWSLGEYTVWVGTSDRNLFHEETFVLKYGYVDAACAPLPLIPGKDLTISGNATGGVDNVSIWILGERTIFGENYPKMGESVPVSADQTYTYTLGSEETANFFSGQYFVIVQHPSYDSKFDVTKSSPPPGKMGDSWIQGASGNKINLSGLNASEAADAVVREINRPECDDLSTALIFVAEQPFITIEPINNHTLGDVFSINGTTNLAVGDIVHYEVVCESFNYTDTHRDPAHGYYGICKNTSVFEGGDSNRYSFEVDTTAWKPDRYRVFVESVDANYTQNASFHLLNRSLYVSLLSGTISPGKSITISGNATGGAENVSVWIIGKGYLRMGEAVPVGADETFSYSLTASETKELSGKYSVVVQHPMADRVFNVRPTTVCNNPFWIVTATGGECNLSGLSAGDAVAALTNAMDSIYSDDCYQVLTFEVKVAEDGKKPSPSQNRGSNGPSGGAAPPPPAQPVPQVIEKIGSAYLEADVNGTVETMTVVLTVEKRGSLSLDVGVTALDLFGRPLEKVNAAQVSAASLPEIDDASLRQVGPGLKCGPDRATFDPAVEICFTLTEDEWKSLGAGEEFVVRWYNSKTGAWEPLRTKVDPGTRQVIARTSHFSTFAVFAEPAAAAPSETVAVTNTASVGGKEMAPDDEGQTEVPPTSAGPAPWMGVVGTGAALVLAGVTSGFWKRR